MWKKCSSCKNPIGHQQKHFVCSVSTCNGLRTGYVFCSVPCFERHLPGARHRDAAAVEAISPGSSMTHSSASVNSDSTKSTSAATQTSAAVTTAPKRIIPTTNQPSTFRASEPQEVLVIASRLKEYIQKKSDFNTSASVMDVISHHIRIISERAIDNARAEGRRTVMDRDFSFLRNIRLD